MSKLSILIPARNEIFLAKTIENLLENIQGDTEIITVCDGYWPKPEIKDHPKVTLIHFTESIGQRAATNVAARLSRSKYLMKVDAHCSFDKGFDAKMISDMQDDWTMVPIMRNLHAFDWICPDGHRRYQGPSGVCKECGKETKMDIVWVGKSNPQSTSYRFDKDLHFQYFQEYKDKQKGDLVETMSLQGSCFMVTKDKYFELDLCEEKFGSWGQQGTEVACKTWLSGGRCIVNKKTWYAHMFRTQGGDFGFPYPLSGNQVGRARTYSKDLFLNNKWGKAKYNLQWLIDKFSPVPGWESIKKEPLPTIEYVSNPILPVEAPSYKNINKGMVYYTDNRCNEAILNKCQQQLKFCCNGNQLISVSLQPINFGENIVLNEQRGVLTMFKQILAGLEKIKSDIVFLVEHDVLYHPSHFDFIPPKRDVFYYNENHWQVDYNTGHSLFYRCRQTSGLCAYRELLLEHYRKRVAKVEKEGFSLRIGYEPGTHNRAERVDDYKAEAYWSQHPNIDIRHSTNLTPNRWRKDQFRRQPIDWKEAEEVPYWGNIKNIMEMKK